MAQSKVVALAMWLCVFGATGCSDGGRGAATRIILVVGATPELEASLDRIEVGLASSNDAAQKRFLRNLPVDEVMSSLPFALVVAPDTRDSGTIAIRGYVGDELRVERLAKLSFRKGKTLLLPVLLSSGCAQGSCGAGNTCGDCGACTPLQIDLDTLPETKDEQTALAAWQPPSCERTQAEGGMDAGDGQGALPDASLPDGATPMATDAGSGLTVSGRDAVATAGCYPVQITQVGAVAVAVEVSGASMFSDEACTQALASGSASSAMQRTIHVTLTPPLSAAEPNVVRVSVTARTDDATAVHVIEVRKPAKRVVRGDATTCVQLVDDTVQCVGATALGLWAQASQANAMFAEPNRAPGLSGAFTTLASRASNACGIQAGAAQCWGLDRWGQLGDGASDGSTSPVSVVGLGAMVTTVEVGTDHACAVQDGKVYCWGRNDDGRVANSATQAFDTPQQRTDLASAAVEVGVSDDRSCAVLDSGKVQCWGGAAGAATDIDLGGAVVEQLSGLGRGMCARTTDQGVYCWGLCEYGECASETPTKVPLPGGVQGTALRGIATGPAQACTWSDRDLYCWGANDGGRLGGGTASVASAPVRVLLPAGEVQDVAIGGDTWRNASCAIVDGLTYCWGLHLSGELGVSAQVGDLLQPTSVQLLDDLVADQVFLASWPYLQDATSAAASNRAAWFWGRGDRVLGSRELQATIVPLQLSNLTQGVAQLELGAYWAVARASDRAYTWGIGTYSSLGQLASEEPGAGPAAEQTLPSELVFPGARRVVDVTAGFFHGCARVEPDAAQPGSPARLYCWGQGHFGQLGDGDASVHAADSPVLVLDELASVTDVAASYAATCAVVGGGLSCWGNFNAQVAPTAVAGLSSGLAQVEMTDSEVCVRTSAGAVKCVAHGESAIRTLVLGKPSDAVKAVEIKAAPSHACALGDDGKLYCWGSNENGQLGAGDRAVHTGAVQVAGLVGKVSGFAVGYELGVTCARDSVGWKCWGNNSYRAMGLEPFVQATPRLMLGWEN